MGEEMTAGRFAWLGARLCCKAVLDFLYTVFVVVLAIITCLTAYVSTLDELPVPQFLIKELEGNLTAQNMALKMDGIRLRPNGRITIDSPKIESKDFEAVIGEAQRMSFKIDMALALVGHIKLDEASITGGVLKAPPVLSPTGLPEVVFKDIDLHAERGRGHWKLSFGRLRFGNAKLFASGEIGSEIYKSRRGQEAPAITPNDLFKKLPQVWKVRDQLGMATNPFASISLIHSRSEGQTAVVDAFAEKMVHQSGIDARWLSARVETAPNPGLTARLRAERLNLKNGYAARSVFSLAHWKETPNKANPYPAEMLIAAGNLLARKTDLGSFIGNAAFIEDGDIDLNAVASIGNQAWSGYFKGDLSKLQGVAELEGMLDQSTIDLVNDATDLSLGSVTIPGRPAEVAIQAVFDESVQPSEARVNLVSDVIIASEARFENAIARAKIEGNDILVEDLWVRSGPQHGWMSIGFNPETKKRRFLIDGHFNPKTINGWFPDWWDNYWDNFIFPENGFRALMDTSAIHLQPQTFQLTGLFEGENVTIRGHEMESIRTKFFNKIYYFDLYDMEIQRKEGYLEGEAQIAMARDPRDGIEKLAGLWVDVESTIDVMIGPDVINEVREETADILEPYQYEIPPKIQARASNVRIRDDYEYDIDLRLDTDSPLIFFDFPFESVKADVHIDNDIITVDNGLGGVGGGILKAKAVIVDDVIDLETTLEEANFGKSLVAAVDYFEASEPDDLEEPIDREELIAYDGILNASFAGKGIVGDSQSYVGKGEYEIENANLYQFQLFGALSKAMEVTPFRFTTLKFDKAHGAFEARKRYLDFPDLRITGPIAQINSDGNYDLEEESLDFKAKLFPFRNSQMPIVPLLAIVLDPVSRFMEVRVTGSLSEPKIRLFSPSETNTEPLEVENQPEISAENSL